MNRKREQADLVYKLGQVLGPLEKVVSDPNQYDSDERERIRARFLKEWPAYYNAICAFCEGEPGHRYGSQQEHVAGAYNNLQHRVTFVEGFEKLREPLDTNRQLIIEQVLSIPVPIDSAIYAARTPFTTYCLMKDLCSTVRQQIVWLDRYFDQTVFHRFFTDTPAAAQVTLVTRPRSALTDRRDITRMNEFMDVSRLFAQERGPQGYRLVENPNFHDRWLRCDDKLFTLGGSIKDLDKGPFTVSRLDFTPPNRQNFDDAIAQGTEVFGPTQTTHP